MMGVRRAWWAVARRWWALALLATLGAALCVRLPAAVTARAHFPRHAPAALAHLLADFSMQPHVGSWRVESDRSNYTSWRYTVTYECGARCAGRAAVQALELHAAAPRHGRAARHAVRVAASACTALPLLPWITLCDEVETTATVTSDGAGGALLEQRRESRCAAAAALSGACASRLRRDADEQLLRLRRALP